MLETPSTGAQTIHPNNEKSATPIITYSAEAQKYIMFRRQRMIAARDTRDAPRDEYDGMGFLAYMDILKKQDDQYIAPRKNPMDTSINVGTVRDKDTSLVEYAQKYDFEPVASVYDEEDEMLEEVAETAEDMIRKSFMMEEAKIKGKLIARSMVAFGTALVEDLWAERWATEKEFGTGKSTIGSAKTEWTEKKVKKYDGAQIKLWDLRKCFFGDIRKFFMNGPQGQPFFFTVEYESYDVVKTMFEDWERWKYVPTMVTVTPEVSTGQAWGDYWTLRPVTLNYVEIVRYYDPIANEFAITLNGVDMLPIQEKANPAWKDDPQFSGPKFFISAFPLTAISSSGMIPFAKFDLEPMHDFAISKSQPGKMRILADVENMWIKLILIMMKQKAKPTMGNKSGKNFGEEVTEPGQIVNDVRDGDIFPILPNFQGATTADFSFYNLLKQELAKNSVEDSWQGIDNQGSEMTATQDMNNMKSQSLKIAATFDGLTFGWSQLFWLRTYNLIKNWTKPIDIHIDVLKKSIENKYRTVSVPATGENGGSATKKIIFTKDTPVRPKGKPTLDDSMDLHQQEMDMKKDGGKEVLLTHLHPEVLATMKLNWYYCCIPVINETDPLAYMMFAKQLGDAINAFGPEALQVKKLKYKFAKMTGNDFDTWFKSEMELQQQAVEQAQIDPATGQPVAGGGGKAPAINPVTAHGAQGGARPTIAKVAQEARPQMGAIFK